MAKYYKNLVQKLKYEARTDFDDVKGRQYPTMTFMSNELIPGSNMYIEEGWIWDMPDPNPHIPEHTHAESDEFVLHIGSDYKNPEDLGGEIEFVVGVNRLKSTRLRSSMCRRD
jgi:hypothetical protein